MVMVHILTDGEKRRCGRMVGGDDFWEYGRNGNMGILQGSVKGGLSQVNW